MRLTVRRLMAPGEGAKSVPGLTTSFWMAVVAGVALGLTILFWRAEGQRRSAARSQEAARHARAAGLTPFAGVVELRPGPREYHRRMMRKWLDAARHPWTPVPPDPPEPE
jgi:hypothetical protein